MKKFMKKLRALAAKPFIALFHVARRRWYPTDQEKIAAIIPDWEFPTTLIPQTSITYSGDIIVGKRKTGEFIFETEINGMPVPKMDPYILTRNSNGIHVRHGKIRKVEGPKPWGPGDTLEIEVDNNPNLSHCNPDACK